MDAVEGFSNWFILVFGGDGKRWLKKMKFGKDANSNMGNHDIRNLTAKPLITSVIRPRGLQ